LAQACLAQRSSTVEMRSPGHVGKSAYVQLRLARAVAATALCLFQVLCTYSRHAVAAAEVAPVTRPWQVFGAVPPAVVVHGRRGKNSEINGVYILDQTWQGQQQVGPCYRRSGAMSRKTIFLYFEGEWRMGPSPVEGGVWAFARSGATSPLLIDMQWEVWDGSRVLRDPDLRVSDTSVIPAVVFLSFSAETPHTLRVLSGTLVQQPGLWDGRPYYQSQAWSSLFLVCSAAEGRWRLGPLPALGVTSGDGNVVVFARSAAALPQEISEAWTIPGSNETGDFALADGSVRLATTASVKVPGASRHPKHLVIEGVTSEDGVANGVYRRAPDPMNGRPSYHKTDALRTASLWFIGGDWRLGSSIDDGRIWAFASSTALSPLDIDAPWQQLEDGLGQDRTRIIDAYEAIPGSIPVAGENYIQQPRLCDARPVYQREKLQGDDDAVRRDIYLFYRVHENEWWIGPVIGGSVCYARAPGSRLHVVPDETELVWHQPVSASMRVANETTQSASILPIGDSATPWNGSDLELGDADGQRADLSTPRRSHWRYWCGLAITALLAWTCGAIPLSHIDARPAMACKAWHAIATRVTESTESPSPPGANGARARRRPSALACVVCFQAPREILLIPCRHVCCCKACADRLQLCPMCRSPKTAFTKVFL